MNNYTRQIAAILDRAGLNEATICGVSFGGIPAVSFAATYPARTTSLIIVSAPGSNWHLRPRHQLYCRFPWLFVPLFLFESPFRLRVELRSTFPGWRPRWRFARWQLRTLARAPLSPPRMAQRAMLLSGVPLADCARITAPTLVVVGEPELDRVVPVQSTMAYTELIARAHRVTLNETGHLGTITRPEAFASIVREFVERPHDGHRLAGDESAHRVPHKPTGSYASA
jgi:pimeloyl-ACP methyl ester carboxylesterase